MVNVIAANRISCKPQKLQAKSATVKIRGGNLRKVGQSDRQRWLPCHGHIVEQSWIGCINGHWQGVGWRARRCAWRGRGMAAVQAGCSDGVVSITVNFIAANRISCKPQKLQEK
jgi:hypothetical protein